MSHWMYYSSRTEFLPDSHEILKLSAFDKVTGFLTTNTITDMYYVLYKNSRDAVKSRDAITQLIKLVTLEAVIPSDISFALASDIVDLEDAVVCFVAKRIKADYIITRNISDFTNSPVPVIEPVNFLSKHFPKN